MIVMVTGSRTFDDYPALRDHLDSVAPDASLVIHGGAPGADALASHWAYERKVNLQIFGAQWGTHGSKAGPLRNSHMIRHVCEVYGDMPDEVVLAAFPSADSRGTWDCVRKATSARIRVEVLAGVTS